MTTADLASELPEHALTLGSPPLLWLLVDLGATYARRLVGFRPDQDTSGEPLVP